MFLCRPDTRHVCLVLCAQVVGATSSEGFPVCFESMNMSLSAWCARMIDATSKSSSAGVFVGVNEWSSPVRGRGGGGGGDDVGRCL